MMHQASACQPLTLQDQDGPDGWRAVPGGCLREWQAPQGTPGFWRPGDSWGAKGTIWWSTLFTLKSFIYMYIYICIFIYVYYIYICKYIIRYLRLFDCVFQLWTVESGSHWLKRSVRCIARARGLQVVRDQKAGRCGERPGPWTPTSEGCEGFSCRCHGCRGPFVNLPEDRLLWDPSKNGSDR